MIERPERLYRSTPFHFGPYEKPKTAIVRNLRLMLSWNKLKELSM